MPIDLGQVHYKEIEIIGTVSPRQRDFVNATKLMKYELIDMTDVLGYVFPMEEAQKAFEQAITPGTYRVVIKYQIGHKGKYKSLADNSVLSSGY